MPSIVPVTEAQPKIKTLNDKGLIPYWLVVCVQVVSGTIRVLVGGLIGIPFNLLILVFTAFDYFWSQILVRYAIGTFCEPCAWIFIWIWKLPTFPILLLGWIVRFSNSFIQFMVDGWMLFFGGSGCFLRWGYDCQHVIRFKDRHYYQIGQLNFWMRDLTFSLSSSPKYSFRESVQNHF